MTPTCVLYVAGERFADTVADLLAGEPTALAELAVNWGRDNTFDQPAPATCTFTVLDANRGTLFTDRVYVGAPVAVYAAGDIAAGTPVDVAVDGGFETAPVGPVGNRAVTVAPAVATIVAAPVHTGTRALQVTSPAARTVVRIPPAAFTPGDPAGWDAIPRLGPNPWTWAVTVRPPLNARTSVVPIGFPDPQTTVPTGIVGAAVDRAVWGTKEPVWTTLTAPVTAAGPTVDDWLGLSVATDLATWAAPYGQTALAYPWTSAPGTWVDYAPTGVDAVTLMAPAGGTVRDVLVFAGRVTDLAATIDDPAGTYRIDVTAIDQLADLENRYVGGDPWPSEPFAARVDRILAAAGGTTTVTIDPGIADLIVTWRDVDNQSAGGMLAELAAGVDAVRWSATHDTTGEYLWIEDVGTRTQVELLELVNGFVTVVIDTGRPDGRTVLDGCQIAATDLTWIRDVSDVVTRVDATWKEQTVNDEGLPAPTDRAIRVGADPALESVYGVRRYGLSTPLVTEADARAAGERVMARTVTTQGRVDGLTWDLGVFPPVDPTDMVTALDLLDGTIRVGRGVIVDRATLWPDGGPIGVYLDGGQYVYDGAWTLALFGTPLAGVGASAEWNDLDPTWAWDEFDPAIAWADLYGAAGPLAEMRT